MENIRKINIEIFDLTLRIEQEYPELYKYLEENPMTIPCCDQPKVNPKNFSEYLDSLKQLLKNHIESHDNTHKM